MNNRFKKYLKVAIPGLICIILYAMINTLEEGYLSITNIDYNTMPTSIKVAYLTIWEIVIAAIIMLILNKKISRDISDMKENHKTYFKKYFKYWLISIGIMMISNAIINLLGNDISGNEEVLRDTFKISPFYIYFSSVIFAPIVEELIFRQSIRNIIPNKLLFIIVSGFIFGGLHVLTGFSNPLDLLYLIPYCAPGIAFAYILADSDNILISMGLHYMHNGVLIALQFILLIFG